VVTKVGEKDAMNPLKSTFSTKRFPTSTSQDQHQQQHYQHRQFLHTNFDY
jgi:hypothetical protein